MRALAGTPFLWFLDLHDGQAYTEAYNLKNAVSDDNACPGIAREPEGVPALNPFDLSVPNDRCRYVDSNPADTVLVLRERVLASIGVTPWSYMTLHLRRGDATQDCDTSINRVASYLDCSIPTAGVLPEGPTYLLIFTDETSSAYLDHLKSTVEGVRRVDGVSRVLPVLGDALVTTVLHDAIAAGELSVPTDNYFNFEVGKAIQATSTLPMRQRRGFDCKDCYDGIPCSRRATDLITTCDSE